MAFLPLFFPSLRLPLSGTTCSLGRAHSSTRRPFGYAAAIEIGRMGLLQKARGRLFSDPRNTCVTFLGPHLFCGGRIKKSLLGSRRRGSSGRFSKTAIVPRERLFLLALNRLKGCRVFFWVRSAG